LALASGSWRKGTNAPYLRSPIVEEERIKPGQWLRLVFYVPFSVLTLMAGWQKDTR